MAHYHCNQELLRQYDSELYETFKNIANKYKETIPELASPMGMLGVYTKYLKEMLKNKYDDNKHKENIGCEIKSIINHHKDLVNTTLNYLHKLESDFEDIL